MAIHELPTRNDSHRVSRRRFLRLERPIHVYPREAWGAFKKSRDRLMARIQGERDNTNGVLSATIPTAAAAVDEIKKPKRSRRFVIGAATVGLATLIGADALFNIRDKIFAGVKETIIEKFRKIEAAPITYDPNRLFDQPRRPGAQSSEVTSTSLPSVALTREVAIRATPTPEPAKLAAEQIRGKHIAEFFLRDLVELLKNRRIARTDEPRVSERLNSRLITTNTIGILSLVIDETRERDFSGEGIGSADGFTIILVDPFTFSAKVVSLPREIADPRLGGYNFDEGARINMVTRLKDRDTFETARDIAEAATGIPVDIVLQHNIDFMQGYNEDDKGFGGFFDVLFPGGLVVDVPKTIRDLGFPVGVGKKVLVIPSGKQVMDAEMITAYMRTRHGDNNFERNERQRQVLQIAGRRLTSNVIDELKEGETETLNKFITFLEAQVNHANFYYDVNLIEVIKTIRNNLIELRSSPIGIAILAALYENTRNAIDNYYEDGEMGFTMYGPSRVDRMLTDVTSRERFYHKELLRPVGSTMNAPEGPHGNYLDYWRPLRRRMQQFIG